MANIQQRISNAGEVSYRVQVRLRGYPTQTATFKRKTDAKNWAQKTEAAIRDGRHFPSSESKRRTLGDLVDKRLKEIEEKKPHAYKKQKQLLSWWKDELGDYSLARITPALIAERRDKLLAENIGTPDVPRKRTAPTANRYLAALSKAYTQAMREWHWRLHESPVRRVSRGEESRGVVRWLSDDERERLLRACADAQAPRWLHPLVLLALTTGGRRGELLGLTWTDFDQARGTVTFQKTKNGERRTVPVVGAALRVLKEWAKVRRIDTDLIFPGDVLGILLEIYPAWYAALERAKVDNFRFHDLRHSAASYLAMSGATAPEIAAVLGHKTLAMVKRYAHLGEQHTAGVVTRMAEKFLPS